MLEPDSREQRLETALLHVMEWIEGWDPSFLHDPEWPATYAEIVTALEKEDNG